MSKKTNVESRIKSLDRVFLLIFGDSVVRFGFILYVEFYRRYSAVLDAETSKNLLD